MLVARLSKGNANWNVHGVPREGSTGLTPWHCQVPYLGCILFHAFICPGGAPVFLEFLQPVDPFCSHLADELVHFLDQMKLILIQCLLQSTDSSHLAGVKDHNQGGGWGTKNLLAEIFTLKYHSPHPQINDYDTNCLETPLGTP